MNRRVLSLILLGLGLVLPAEAFAQTIPPIERAAGACAGCAADGWVVSTPSPDIIVGNGPWPGSGAVVVSDVSGGPAQGSNMMLALSSGLTREAVSTAMTGLTSGSTYSLSVFYQGARVLVGSVYYENGDFALTVGGTTTYFATSTGDAWTEAEVSFVATGTTELVTLSIRDLGTGSAGGAVVADSITVAPITAVPDPLLLRVDEAGQVFGYGTLPDFVSDQNGFSLGPPISDYIDDRGFLQFQGIFYAISESGVITAYGSAMDFATNSNGSVVGTVPSYGDDVGFLSGMAMAAIATAPSMHPWLLVGLMVSLLAGGSYALRRAKALR